MKWPGLVFTLFPPSWSLGNSDPESPKDGAPWAQAAHPWGTVCEKCHLIEGGDLSYHLHLILYDGVSLFWQLSLFPN